MGMVCGLCWHRYARVSPIEPTCFVCGRVREIVEDLGGLF